VDPVEKLVRFGVSIPEQMLASFDGRIEQSGFPNRSDALRRLIRQYISADEWEEGTGRVYGSVTLLFDHHRHDTSEDLNELQHDFLDVILCTTHVHIDNDHCLELIAIHGEPDRIRSFLNRLTALKGDFAIRPVITTVV